MRDARRFFCDVAAYYDVECERLMRPLIVSHFRPDVSKSPRERMIIILVRNDLVQVTFTGPTNPIGADTRRFVEKKSNEL